MTRNPTEEEYKKFVDRLGRYHPQKFWKYLCDEEQDQEACERLRGPKGPRGPRCKVDLVQIIDGVTRKYYLGDRCLRACAGWFPRSWDIWEAYNGPLPEMGRKKGQYVIHHKNGDPRDDRIGNLELMLKEDHMKLHLDLWSTLTEDERSKRSRSHPDEVKEFLKNHKGWFSIKEFAEFTGYHPTTVLGILYHLPNVQMKRVKVKGRGRPRNLYKVLEVLPR